MIKVIALLIAFVLLAFLCPPMISSDSWDVFGFGLFLLFIAFSAIYFAVVKPFINYLKEKDDEDFV